VQSGAYHATLGLIANNFVRVAHRVSSDCASNLAPVLSNVKIEAAILSLQHSFIVDNYACGTALAKLTVTGAIVQNYRGPGRHRLDREHRDRVREELLVRRPLPLPEPAVLPRSQGRCLVPRADARSPRVVPGRYRTSKVPICRPPSRRNG